MRSLVCGVGINDADYVTHVMETVGYTDDGRQLQKLIWICPFYRKWHDMLKRCYNKKYKLKYPTYEVCGTIDEWHYFMKFRAWMEAQDWQGKHLDKDLLVPGNKLYSPDTCVFVDPKINYFIVEPKARQGEWPVGVSFNKKRNKFSSNSRDVLDGKQKHLGYYDTPTDAHQAWISFKLEQAKILASQQTDERVAKALVARYENYQS